MVILSKFSTVCHICGITQEEFSKRSYFEKHILLHQKNNQSVCDTCGKIYPNLIALNEHVRVYHGKEHPCTQCEKKFATSNLLKRHMVIHTSNNKFSCDSCTKTFTRFDNLRRHKMEGCNNESQEFSCDICHKYFSRERQLKMHIKFHHESSTITCELCTKVYTSNVHYLYHKKGIM